MSEKRIVLCADDYGQNPRISAGVLALATAGRLSAVSCMCVTPHWKQAAANLLEAAPAVDVGLHFTLTAPSPTGRPLGALIRAACLRQLDSADIARALHAQLDSFEDALGRPPDFIDGHQHVHLLPVVREAFLEVCATRLRGRRFYVRSLQHVSGQWESRFKTFVIRMLGADSLARGLDRAGIPHNEDFAGIHDFRQADFRERMRAWLGTARDGTLFMCHPGRGSSDPLDEIRASRETELSYLGGDAFAADCRALDVRLVRGRDAPWFSHAAG